jgi:sulfatase modifying factor 1
MNAVVGIYRDEMEVNYAVDFGRDREPAQKRSRHPAYRRKGSGPTRVSGMHCRRNKRWTWGSGRGANMVNVRAFAGCLAVAVASLASTSFGVTVDYRLIGDPGNSANGTTGLGAVSSVYKIAAKETTNAEYVEFLNKVDASGTNPNGIYHPTMESSTNGGITFNPGASSGQHYSVKVTSPGRGASTYADMPVNFVTWFDAARYANWLNNGQQSNAASMETGAYTLNNQTSGAIPTRNPGASIFLPSADEWYKAAFYSPSNGYYTWQTRNNSTPLATTTTTGTNSANYASASTGPMSVGSYTNTTSYYGLYDMLGNVTEVSDTAGSGSTYRAFGGGYSAIGSAWNLTASAVYRDSTFINQTYGFRVAAVPEPGTIALAGMGIAGLAGLDWMKRRKRKAAAKIAA